MSGKSGTMLPIIGVLEHRPVVPRRIVQVAARDESAGAASSATNTGPRQPSISPRPSAPAVRLRPRRACHAAPAGSPASSRPDEPAPIRRSHRTGRRRGRRRRRSPRRLDGPRARRTAPRAGPRAGRSAARSRVPARPMSPRRCQRRRDDPGAGEAVAHARLFIVDRRAAPDLRASAPQHVGEHGGPAAARSRAHAPGDHEIKEIALPERPLGGAQQLLLEAGELRQAEGEARVVAERTEVAEVIGDALELERERAQPGRARRRFVPGESLERLAVRPGERDGRIARDPRGQPVAFERAASDSKRRSMPLCT